MLKNLNLSLIKVINGKYHSKYLFLFNLIVLSHFAEHLFQIIQLYILNWERKQALGLLGLWQPWLIHSEWLHYGHALFMVIGLYYLSFSVLDKVSKQWWNYATFLAFCHHIIHFILLSQAITNYNLFNFSTPIDPFQAIGLLFHIGIPRIELHFFYNLVILIPMVISLYKQKNYKECL